MEEPNITTFKHLQKEFDEVYLLADRGIVRLIVATVIANQLNMKPIWLQVVGPSSGGKSALLDSLNGLHDIPEFKNLIIPVSDITVSTFASGQRRTDKETSLLMKMNVGSILCYKDFTSILSKNIEAKAEIMKQLREIYDGSYNKHFGTGDVVAWTGKVGSI